MEVRPRETLESLCAAHITPWATFDVSCDCICTFETGWALHVIDLPGLQAHYKAEGMSRCLLFHYCFISWLGPIAHSTCLLVCFGKFLKITFEVVYAEFAGILPPSRTALLHMTIAHSWTASRELNQEWANSRHVRSASVCLSCNVKSTIRSQTKNYGSRGGVNHLTHAVSYTLRIEL